MSTQPNDGGPAYDSRQETTDHILRVRELLSMVQCALELRGMEHDRSKLGDVEKPIFDRVTGTLRAMTYGSDEYKAALKNLSPALVHHYAHNSHHPEHTKLFKCGICHSILREDQTWLPNINDNPPRLCGKCCPGSPIYECSVDPYVGPEGMSLLDVIEMLCDWKAAGERHADGSMERSLSVNKKRFNISDQLQMILENTANEFGWLKADTMLAAREGGKR